MLNLCMEFLLIFSEILLVMHLYGNHIELNPYFLMVFGSFPEISIIQSAMNFQVNPLHKVCHWTIFIYRYTHRSTIYCSLQLEDHYRTVCYETLTCNWVYWHIEKFIHAYMLHWMLGRSLRAINPPKWTFIEVSRCHSQVTWSYILGGGDCVSNSFGHSYSTCIDISD